MKKAFILLALPWHLLTWSDFKAKPNPKGSEGAMSAMSIAFYWTDLQDGHVIFDSAAVEFYPEKSWTILSDTEHLNHEQGHLNLCLALVRYFNNMSHIHHIHYKKVDFEAMQNEIKRRWDADDLRYDTETDHGNNQEGQIKWDLYLAKQLILNK